MVYCIMFSGETFHLEATTLSKIQAKQQIQKGYPSLNDRPLKIFAPPRPVISGGGHLGVGVLKKSLVPFDARTHQKK